MNFVTNMFANRKGRPKYFVVHPFCGGYAAVFVRQNGRNFIDTSGKVLCKEWFCETDDFFEGYAAVWVVDKGRNFIDISGKILCKERFNKKYADILGQGIVSFSEGYASVYVEGKGWRIIDTYGDYIF